MPAAAWDSIQPRVAGLGHVHLATWAPQLSILQHPKVRRCLRACPSQPAHPSACTTYLPSSSVHLFVHLPVRPRIVIT